MLLTLVPPSHLTIPDTLQTHLVSLPSWPPNVRVTQAWNRAARSLQTVGISIPSVMCVDLTAWGAFAVREVVWNLEGDFVNVVLVDGTEERFTLDGTEVEEQEIKSDEFVATSDDEEPNQSSPASTPLQRSNWMQSSSPLQNGHSSALEGPGIETLRSDPSPPVQRTSPGVDDQSVRSRLVNMCEQVREAFEDVGLGPVSFDCEADHAQLIRMASDPTLKIPPSWNGGAQSLFDFHMNSSSVSSDEDDGVDLNGESVDTQALRQAYDEEAQRRRREASPSLPLSTPPSSPRGMSRKISGQLKSRRRPRSVAEAAGQPNQFPPPYDYLSFVELLAQTRKMLLDLFALKIVPALKDRLQAPTYCEWAAKSAAEWCRLRAYQLSGSLASRLTAMLEQEDETEDEDSYMDELANSSSSDEGGSALQGLRPSRPFSFAAHRQPPIRNPLQDMSDDYQLRLWCEQARQRSVDSAVPPQWGQQPAIRGLTFSSPKFSKTLMPWEVTKTFPLSVGKASGLRADLKMRMASRPVLLPRQLDNMSSSPTRSASSFVRKRSGHARGKSYGSSTSDTESENEHSFIALGPAMQSPKFFYPEDWLGDALLPPKLPKVLVNRDIQPPLTKEMERARKMVHLLLNEIAGLQKRIVELIDYSCNRAKAREKARVAAQPDQTKTKMYKPSGLRNEVTGETLDSDPPKSPTTSVPLRLQPLRLRAADKLVAQAVSEAVQKRSPEGDKMLRTAKLTFVSAKPKSKTQASPRKRARDNLSAIKTALAKTTRKRKTKDKPNTVPAKRRRKNRESVKAVDVRADEDEEAAVEVHLDETEDEEEPFASTSGAAKSSPPSIPSEQVQEQARPRTLPPSPTLHARPASRLSLRELGSARHARIPTGQSIEDERDQNSADGDLAHEVFWASSDREEDDVDAELDSPLDDDYEDEDDESVNTHMPHADEDEAVEAIADDAEPAETDADDEDEWFTPSRSLETEADILVDDFEQDSLLEELPLALPPHVMDDLEALRADTPAPLPPDAPTLAPAEVSMPARDRPAE
ncbi:hypothetical protein ACM66B_003743 [Microbotryomycetes sp. NB124-2]